MFLSTTTQTLELDLNGAVSTNQLPVTLWYVDVSQSTFAMSAMTQATTQSNSTTTVTICAAPGASTTRQIKGFTIKNSDTAAVLLWVQINDNTTLREQTKCTLAVGDTLCYSDTEGYYTTDSSGQRKLVMPGYLPLSGGTISGAITYGGVTLTNAVTGTGKMVLDTSPTLATPNIGVATGTSFQGIIGNVTPAAVTGTAISGTSFVAGATSLTAFAGATTLLTLGGTGATSVVAIPGTKTATNATTASVTFAGGVGIADNLFVTNGITGGAGTFAGITSSVAATGVAGYFKATSGGDLLRIKVYGAGVGANLEVTDSAGTAGGPMTLVGSTYDIYVGSAMNVHAMSVSAAGAVSFYSNSLTAGAGSFTTMKATTLGAFAASDKYVIVDASGNFHISALGPLS